MLYYAVTAFIVVFIGWKLSQPSKLDAIPTVGCTSWFGSWWASVTYLTNARDIIQEGYDKHKSAPFKVAELFRWTVLVSSREHVEELAGAPDNVLSFKESIDEILQPEYTMGREIHLNPYHIALVRSKLTRNIETIYPDMMNELVAAFHDTLDLRDDGWKSVPVLDTVQKVVSRISNRLFVGLPLCRDPEWVDLTIRNTIDVVKGAAIVGLFPDRLKPLAARLFTNFGRTIQRACDLARPTIEGRQKQLSEQNGQWADKPNDFLTWLMEEAKGPELTVKNLTARILALAFSAIHTSSVTFSHVLFYLAAHPPYVQPLREEVERIVEDEGWSKVAVEKMRKVDSFIRECQRLEGVVDASLVRKALRDYTFSDGTFVPKGTTIAVATRPIHLDDAFYKHPRTFKPWRFSDLNADAEESVRHRFASTSTDHLLFGHGRHACPGRFFAANELKCMLAHIVVTYNIRLEDATRPEALRVGTSIIPHPTAKVVFKRRSG